MKNFFNLFKTVIINLFGFIFPFIAIGIVYGQYSLYYLIGVVSIYTILIVYAMLYLRGAFKCGPEVAFHIYSQQLHSPKNFTIYIIPTSILCVAIFISMHSYYFIALYTLLPISINWFANKIIEYKADFHDHYEQDFSQTEH